MLETSGGVRPAEKGAQAELHVSVVVRFKSRFEPEARGLMGRRMMVDPIVDKITGPFRSKFLERLQAPGFHKEVQIIQVSYFKADGMACITVRFEIRRVIGNPGGEVQSGSFFQLLWGPGGRSSTW